MEPSLFIDYVQRYFPRLVTSIVTKINGKDEDENNNPYYFRRFLTREWSMTGRWENLTVYNQRIMADIITMDSSLPLKKRPSLRPASGEIPKLGMEMTLNESQLTELQTLAGMRQVDERQLIKKLFADTATCVTGQYERIEAMFLEGLSRGVIEISKSENVGADVRLDFNYYPENKFAASVVWAAGSTTYKPLDDIVKMVQKAKADGNPIRTMLLDDATFQLILTSDQAKNLFAEVNGIISGITFAPTSEQFNSAVRSKWGFVFEVIERTCRYQIDGTDYDYQPWEAGQIVGINNDALGKLVWATLAEMNAPVAGVVYQRADEFILASKYRENRPSLKEYTSTQARVVPVIGATNQIYKLDTTKTTTT